MRRAVLCLALLLGACIVDRKENEGVAFLRVELVDPAPEARGTPDEPLPLPRGQLTLTVDVTALDRDGVPMDCEDGRRCFNGEVSFLVSPGWIPVDNPIKSPDYAKTIPALRGMFKRKLENGRIQGVQIPVRGAYSTTSVWAEQWSDDSGAPVTYVAGTSEPLYFDYPTLQDLQYDPATMRPNCGNDCNNSSSPLVDNFVRTQLSRYLVTGITAEGFFVTDLNEVTAPAIGTYPGRFNSLFVFNFSYPDDLGVGDFVTRIMGTVQEFTGDTQVTFPTWEKEVPREAFPDDIEKPCTLGEQCPVGFSCDGAPDQDDGRRCMPNGRCRIDDDCSDGFTCQSGSCRLNPVAITAAICEASSNTQKTLCGDNTRNIHLESLESDRVEVVGLMPTEFVNCDFNGDGDVPNQRFVSGAEVCDAECQCKRECIARDGCSELSALNVYGQYIVTLPATKLKLNVITRDANPDVRPTERAGDALRHGGVKVRVRGNLRQSLPARPRWAIVAGEHADFCCLETETERCGEIPLCL